MSHYPTPHTLPSARGEASAVAAALTLAVLVAIPLTQKLSEKIIPYTDPVIEPITLTPPTIVERDPPPPPPVDKPDIKDMKKEVPMPTIDQIVVDINTSIPSDYVVPMDGLIPETGISDLFDSAELTRQPEPVQQVQPRYPHDMKQAKIAGMVYLEFVVTKDGRTRDIRILRSSNPAFEDPAVHAVRRWLFKPGERDGQVVNSRVRLQMPFNVR